MCSERCVVLSGVGIGGRAHGLSVPFGSYDLVLKREEGGGGVISLIIMGEKIKLSSTGSSRNYYYLKKKCFSFAIIYIST